MKQRKKILCGVLAFLLAGTASAAWWQRDNIKALMTAVQYSEEELAQKLEENQQAIENAVSAAPEVVIRDVTEEERQALKDGTLTQEELIDRLLNTETPEAPAAPQPSGPGEGQTQPPVQAAKPETPPAPQPETPPPEAAVPLPEADYQKQLSAIIAEVYVLREQYTIELDNMYAAAKAEYKAMPKSKRTTEKLSKWAMGYVSRANQLEKKCDASMDSVVERMEKLIKENNGDLSLVDTVVYTYASEKSLKKAFYMSKLEKRGLI